MRWRTLPRMLAVVSAALALFPPGSAEPRTQPAVAATVPDLHQAVEDLLAADRRFSQAAAGVEVADALSAMFTEDVIVPGPTGLTIGRAAVARALREAPGDAASRAQWTPIRGGVSADGQHGFTFGYMTITGGHGEPQSLKYMAYWMRGAAGWRVAGYKRAPRPPGPTPTSVLPPYVPSAPIPVTHEATRLGAHRRSLAEAERAFSDEAQRIGLGPAFAKYGAATAVNMGGPQSSAYLEGPEAISAAIGAGAPGSTSPVHWASETVLVASSGDLGISFGYIKAHSPSPGAPASGRAFFTIWVRPAPDAPWRYIAE